MFLIPERYDEHLLNINAIWEVSLVLRSVSSELSLTWKLFLMVVPPAESLCWALKLKTQVTLHAFVRWPSNRYQNLLTNSRARVELWLDSRSHESVRINSHYNSPVLSSTRPLDKKTKHAFVQGKCQFEINYSQMSMRRRTIHYSVHCFVLKFRIFLLVFVQSYQFFPRITYSTSTIYH